VLYLGYLLHLFAQRVPDPVFVLEKGRQKTAANVAILVYRRIQHGAAILPVPDGIVGPASKEGDTKWRPADNHQSSLL
jgi:hypothetical protein